MDGGISRDDLAALERRIAALELEVRQSGVPSRVVRCVSCSRMVPASNFCASCGARLAPAAPAAPLPAPAAAARAPAAPPPVAPAPAGIARPPPAPPARAVQPLSLDRALGQRWAPRLGAALVFLGTIFFLGVAIQRGWIGPLAQLAIAVVGAVGLLTVGAILSARRGYGTYPQVLEATGACVLYVTAFVAHALPYYERATGLTEIGSALIMAAVALGTVALALARDARIIAGLGYGLAFLTALLGVGTMPGLTLAYVALLGASLAMLVAVKGWLTEGVVGSLATGGLLLGLAYGGDPSPGLVAAVALVPAAAFLWLALRRVGEEREEPLVAILVVATFAWGATVTQGATDDTAAKGWILLAWAVVAGAYVALAARAGGARLGLAAGSVAGLLLWVVGAPLAWSGLAEAALLTTLTYALGALALAVIGRFGRRGAAMGSLVLAGVAAFHALSAQPLLRAPWEAAPLLGPWQAWATLVAVLAPLALVGSARATSPASRIASFWVAAAFGTMWTFALFGAPLVATLWLLLLAAGLVGLGLLAAGREPGVAWSAVAAAFAIVALAALKGITVDMHAPEVRLEPLAAGAQSVVLAGALLALFHVARGRALIPRAGMDLAAFALIGGSAVVLASYLLVYTEGAWPSILTGALGVAYLVAGWLRSKDVSYRYAGFAVLGFVLVRVFVVDMRNADLAIRALTFAVLGAILLGIGYAYARISRKDPAPEPEPLEMERAP